MRTRPLLVVLLVVVLGVAACGAGGPGQATPGAGGGAGALDVEVRPFAEVQASELTFEADPLDPRRAVFRVTTTEPMICAIVWGADDSFGRFNNSLAMDGTGIEQHDVVLPGVEAGEYLFVVQGTTADGTLYRSEVSTFSVEALAATGGGTEVEVGENLALGATVVDVSSAFSEAFAAERAIDGDGMTEWSTSGDGDAGSITLDLGAAREVAAVEFVTRSMADGSAVTDTYTVTVDGDEPLGPFLAGTPVERRVIDLAVTGRVLRFDVEASTGGNVGAVEIGVYAPPAAGG